MIVAELQQILLTYYWIIFGLNVSTYKANTQKKVRKQTFMAVYLFSTTLFCILLFGIYLLGNVSCKNVNINTVATMEHYLVGKSERVKLLGAELKREITELKNEVEECEMLFGNMVRPMSSFSSPMNETYFEKERELVLNNLLHVDEILPPKSQGSVICDEFEATLKSDFSEKNIPLILHQFYLDQVEAMVQCKHLHMLRWSRFCEHTDAIERVHHKYNSRLDEVNKQYSDSKSRAKRLASSYHAHVLGVDSIATCWQADDLVIYLRWLVTNMHLTKKFSSYLKILQWLPTIHKSNINLQVPLHGKPTSELEIGMVGFDAKLAWKQLAGSDFSQLSPSSRSHKSQVRRSSYEIGMELSFGGVISNETGLCVPVHLLDLHMFRDQLETLSVEYGILVRSEILTSADEMELFGAVNRRFKMLFNRQLDCNMFYQYDNVPEGKEHWGIDSPSHCLKKPGNWTKFIRQKPHRNVIQMKQMTKLKKKGKIDELLRSQNMFFLINDHITVTEALKDHAVAVRDPPTVQALHVTSHCQGKLKTSSIWQQIYESSQQTVSTSNYGKKMDSSSLPTSRFQTHSKKRDSYDYANTMQMLGLDEGEESSNQDPTIIQGALLSFHHLRHLKIRDMKRQCLAVLNYFRSIERSITIYDGGLSLESTAFRTKDESKPQREDGKGEKPSKNKSQARGIGSHEYIYNTPADFKIEQTKFMEFGGIENHDDFYSYDIDENEHQYEHQPPMGGSGEWQSSISAAIAGGSAATTSIPHVQDQKGYYIIYEDALNDLKEIEDELLLVASHYIEKDIANRSVMRRSAAELSQLRQQAPGEVDIAAYAHRDVDRFAVICDIWTCELNFLVNKHKLLNCYYEAYQNTFSHVERRSLSQILTDIIYQRPRYDFTKEYFVKTYKAECSCLNMKTTVLKQILSNQIDESRHYISKVVKGPHVFGMPFQSSAKQDIALNSPKPALKYLDILEFHPSLGTVASRFTVAIDLAINELTQIHQPTCMEDHISLEKQVLEHAHHEWEGLANIGTTYSMQIQRNVFSDLFVEDPNLLIETVQSLIKDVNATAASESSPNQSNEVICETWRRCIEMVVLRQRLIEAAWETEILSRLYKLISSEVGFEEHHMYMRLVQFEFANFKEKVDISPSLRTSFVPDEINADRYIPSNLLLAVQEMDENHLPKFAFCNREGIIQILCNDGNMNIHAALACQVVHKNCLIVAITLFNNCFYWKEIKSSLEHEKELSDNKSSHSVSTTLTQGTVRSGGASPSGMKKAMAYSGKLNFGFDKQKKTTEAFLSVQLEKLGPRDVVVNAFVRKKETSGMLLKKPGEIEKCKRALVIDFCREVSFRMSIHAMRAQIIACYSSILYALQGIPMILTSFFMVGSPHEKKHKQDGISGMIPDPKSLHRRPRRVLSPDGSAFLNLWFIPHFTEILVLHRNLDYENQHKVLSNWLLIAASLHDIVLYLCSHAHLGGSISDQLQTDICSDWGGSEGIGSDMREIQQLIDTLPCGPFPNTKNPSQVAQLLDLRKKNLYSQFEAAVNLMIPKTFLATGNIAAHKSVTDLSKKAFSALNYKLEMSVTCLHFTMPQPLSPGSPLSAKLFPWLSFLLSNGPHPTSYPTHWRNIEACVHLCLSSLSDSERKIANGDILGVNLILQEVLQSGKAPLLCMQGPADEMPKGFIMLSHVGKDSSKYGSATKIKKDTEAKEINEIDVEDLTKPISLQQEPIEAYTLLQKYLKVWKQFEFMKQCWGESKMHVLSIDSSLQYRDFNHVFCAEVVLPLFTSIARQMGYLDEYSDTPNGDEPVKLPPHASDFVVKLRLLIKLLEITECNMISEVRQRISREITQVLAERSREENALPTDIWRHNMGENGVKENFTVTRPLIVEDFVQKLYSQFESKNGSVIFSKNHLQSCISSLGSHVMQRERDNYESYAVYYESLLRHHHHLLYLKELELQSISPKNGSTCDSNNQISSQFQLADRSHELILEITALRSKITEMRQQSLVMDQEIRDDVKRDYQELVQNLFEVCFQLKNRLSECHLTINDDVRLLIGETREDAMRSLGKLKSETPSSTAEERLRTIAIKQTKIEALQEKHHGLSMLLKKLNALHHWKQTANAGKYKVTVEKLNQEVNNTRLDCLGMQMLAKEEADLLKEELISSRKSLKESENHLRKAFQQIEREKQTRKEKEHEELQAQRNRQQLEQARQRNMSRLVLELEEKSSRLHSMTTDMQRSSQIEQNQQTKIQRSLKQMHAQLSFERNLKLDAFDRVDCLQAQVMESERDIPVQAVSTARTAINRSRPTSSYFSSQPTTMPFAKIRPLSSVPTQCKVKTDVPFPRKRPQTASGRLKSSIAAALLTEIIPATDEHETVIQLRKNDK